MALFSAVSGEQMRMVQIITGAAMALFIGIGVVPGLRRYAGTIRPILLAGYLVACAVFIGWLMLR